MTRTVCLSLGMSTLIGKQAVDQVQRFKCQLFSLLKKPDSVTLLTVEDVENAVPGSDGGVRCGRRGGCGLGEEG